MAEYRCMFETGPKSVCDYTTTDAVDFARHTVEHGDSNPSDRPLRDGPGRRMQGRKPRVVKKNNRKK